MEEQSVSLTIDDLKLALSIINVSCQRGAIKAEEMKTVGGLYDKIVAFVKQATGSNTDSDSTADSEDQQGE